MQPIDWIQVGLIALGATVGTCVGYRLARRRSPNPREAVDRPGQRATLLAFAAFAGCAVAEDLVRRLGHVDPGGAFLLKYIFATATGIGQYAQLRRNNRILASRTPTPRASGGPVP